MSGGPVLAHPEVWLPLDEGTGNVAADYSGNARNATVFGATWTPGRSGSALSLDGQSDYINANLDLSRWLGGTASLAFWLKTTQTGSDNFANAPGVSGVYEPGSSNDIGWGWLDRAGHIEVGAGVAAVSSGVVNDGQWHFIVLTRDATSGQEQVFVDGALEESAVGQTGGITAEFSSIGRIESTAGGATYFAGELDDIQIYSQTLAAAQVLQEFQNGPAAHGSTPPVPAAPTSALIQQENAQISQLREGNAEVNVVDQFGNPVANVSIDAREVQSQFPFGSAINSNVLTNQQYADFFKSHFNTAAMEDESTWYYNEPTQGNVTYAVADAIASYAQANNISLRGPALFWGDPSIIQPWLKQLSPADLLNAVESRLESAVTHFEGTFDQWTVDNELLNSHFFQDALGPSIVPWMFQQVRALDPNVKLFVNDYNAIEGTATAAYIAEIKSLEAQGAEVDGIGVQGHFTSPVNPQDVTARLNSLGQLGLPIWITEFDTVNADPNLRAADMQALYRAAFSNPNVQGILMWGFWAGSIWRGPNAAMVNQDWTLNADGQAYEDLMHAWTTVADGATDGNGQFAFRGFGGTYDITVTGPGGQTTVQQVTLNADSSNHFTIQVNVAPPTAVTNLVASGADSQVALSWAAVSGATSYNIYRSTTSGSEGAIPIQAGVTKPSFVDSGTVNGTTYYYQVAAVDSAGLGVASSEAMATPRAIRASLWSNSTLPSSLNAADKNSVELGLEFQPAINGYITSIRFYKPANSNGPNVGNLWTANGTLLATASFSNETASGWQQANFAQPVAVQAGQTYVASYLAPKGDYADTTNFFATPFTNGPLTALTGVYRYSSSNVFPSTTSSSNYWVDAVLVSSLSAAFYQPTVSVVAPGGAYNGSAYAASGVVTGLNGLNLGTPTLTYYAGSSASGTALPDSPTSAGTYTVLASYAGSQNYSSATNQATFVITPAKPTVTVAAPGGVYNGSPYAASGSITGLNGANLGTPIFSYFAGSTASGNVLAAAPTNAGTYTVLASYAGSQNYSSATNQATFAISQAKPTVSVTSPGGVFTGSSHAASGSVAGINGISLGTPTLTYYAATSASGTSLTTAPTNAGTYTVLASYKGSQNYSSGTSQATFVIIPAKPTVTVTAPGGVYNGSPYKASGSVTGLNGVNLGTPTFRYYAGSAASGNVLSAAPTNAGTYTVLASYAGSQNYSSATNQATFVVSHAKPTVRVTAAGGAYSGSPNAASGAVTGLNGISIGTPTFTYYAGSSASGTALPGAPTGAGTYTVLASYAGSQNYSSAASQATFVITPAKPTVTVKAPGGGYNGSPYAASGSVTGLKGVNLGTPTFSYYAGIAASGIALAAAPTNAGTYTVLASYAGSQNYGSATNQATFVISQAKPAVSVTAAGGAYTGSPYAASGVVTGVNGVNLGTPTFTYYVGSSARGTALAGAPTGAGTYTVLASYAGSQNYSSATKQTTFVIQNAPQPQRYSLWPTTAPAPWVNTLDSAAVNLGVQFQASSSGYIKGIRFYKGANDSGVQSVSLWSSAGALLATTAVSGLRGSGWVEVDFATPVQIQAGQTYVASYFTTKGNYADTLKYFTAPFTNGPLTALGGVYQYSSSSVFPGLPSYENCNYWVDVVFQNTVS